MNSNPEPASEIVRSARLSPCGTWRYYLSRHWATTGEVLTFVMLNPSTADASVDDPTIRRCTGFARREGYAGIAVLNLYAYRATDPKALRHTAGRNVGPENDAYLSLHFTERVRRGLPVVAAWGSGHASEMRIRQVMTLVPGVDWRCLGATKDGSPRHPLYVRGDQPLVPFVPVTADV